MKPRGLDSVRFPHKRGKERKNEKKKKETKIESIYRETLL